GQPSASFPSLDRL
ncbi:hypothetical protein D039_3598B, partial [Vibrio parahaemolyticus EKP-028]